jgi:hypothetical protein
MRDAAAGTHSSIHTPRLAGHSCVTLFAHGREESTLALARGARGRRRGSGNSSCRLRLRRRRRGMSRTRWSLQHCSIPGNNPNAYNISCSSRMRTVEDSAGGALWKEWTHLSRCHRLPLSLLGSLHLICCRRCSHLLASHTAGLSLLRSDLSGALQVA